MSSQPVTHPANYVWRWLLYEGVVLLLCSLPINDRKTGRLVFVLVPSILLAKMIQLTGTVLIRDREFPRGLFVGVNCLPPVVMFALPLAFPASALDRFFGLFCAVPLVFLLLLGTFAPLVGAWVELRPTSVMEAPAPQAGQFSLQRLFLWTTILAILFGLTSMMRQMENELKYPATIILLGFSFIFLFPFLWWQIWLTRTCQWFSDVIIATLFVVACPLMVLGIDGIPLTLFLGTLALTVNIHLTSMRASGLRLLPTKLRNPHHPLPKVLPGLEQSDD